MRPRLFIAVLVLVSLPLGQRAMADERDSRRVTHQSGAANSGDAIAGQVTAADSAGDVSVDATNATDGADVQTGDARGYNDIEHVEEPSSEDRLPTTADLRNHRFDEQRRNHFIDTLTMSGDGIAGQVIGVVARRGGSADVVAANSSIDDFLRTGDSRSHDSGDSSTGDALGGQVLSDVTSGRSVLDATNLSEDVDASTGDALAFFDDATAVTGNSIGGQIGAVVTASGGSSDVVLANTTELADLDTGDARSNDATAVTGDAISGESAAVAASGRTSLDATNLSSRTDTATGDARAVEDTVATSGDGITGLVVGVLTNRRAEADVVEANISTETAVITGDARSASHEDFEFGDAP